MKRFKNILIYCDTSKPDRFMLERACCLARRNEAKVKIVDVVCEIPRDPKKVIKSADSSKVRIAPTEDCYEKLIRHANVFEDIGIECKILTGRPYAEIIREVIRSKHDLVILAAEGISSIKERFFGTKTLHLMRKCPCPVWVMKPTQTSGYGGVLAAVSVEPSNTQIDALNVNILETASSLASIEGSELHLVHAWEIFAEAALTGRAGISRAEVNQMKLDLEQSYQRKLNGLLETAKITNAAQRIHLVEGSAGKEIPKLAAEKKIDIIVMGVRSGAGAKGMFVGSTAEMILQSVECSILVVKPEGFVSPIKA